MTTTADREVTAEDVGSPVEVSFDRAAVVRDYKRHMGIGRARLAEFMSAPVEMEGTGAEVRAADGRVMLDCGGSAVFLLGHSHPAVVDAVAAQLRRNPMSTRVLLEPEQAAAARALCLVAPPGLDHVQFVTSGAEATELGIKLVRAQGRTNLITTSGGFHGKTTGALAVTPNPRYQDRFQPLLPATVVTYGEIDPLLGELSRNPGRSAVIIEPVQGEGGVVVPPSGYLRAVGQACRQFGALLIMDEIQTGLGRCGAMWAHQENDVRPDVLLVGKALSGGVIPVAAVLATDEVFEPIGSDPMLHSSTFAGTPLASAAVIATINTLIADRIPQLAAEIGARLVAELDTVCAPYLGNQISAVRGRGLLIGIEFTRPDLAAEVTASLLRRDIIVNHSFNNHCVMRLTPPAVLNPSQEIRIVTSVAGALAEL